MHVGPGDAPYFVERLIDNVAVTGTDDLNGGYGDGSISDTGGGLRGRDDIAWPGNSVARTFLRGIRDHVVDEQEARELDYAEQSEEKEEANQRELDHALAARRSMTREPEDPSERTLSFLHHEGHPTTRQTVAT